jgi:hypothetical protein
MFENDDEHYHDNTDSLPSVFFKEIALYSN